VKVYPKPFIVIPWTLFENFEAPLPSDENNDKDNSMEKSHPNVINIDKAIMVSDLHLGYEKCNVKAFTDFLDNCISTESPNSILYLF
jgi:hypothetical protein